MNPKMDYRGHDIEYRHFKTERHSGLAPHHFKPRRRPDSIPFLVLLGACITLGAFALTLFVIQVLR